MKRRNPIVNWEFEGGRSFLGRLPHQGDLITAIEGLCADRSIRTGVFSIIGSVTSATLGSYDQRQQVYVTFKKEEALEIVYCTGNISLNDGKVSVHAHGVFADIQGETVGGHVFSDTIVYAGEVFLKELLGRPLERGYDTETGLFLWRTKSSS
jgi:hypothetical protein